MTITNMREAFAETMLDLAQDDPDLVVLVGDISHGILQPYAKANPGRYYNVGICEPTIVGMAAGMSRVGLNPVLHTIAPFLIERSYEQIKLDFGYQGLGVNLISVGGAFDYAQLGCSHHCYTDVSLIAHLEGSSVFMPGSAAEFRTLFRQAYQNQKINYFRLSENPHGADNLTGDVQVGKAVRVRNGDDVTIAVAGPQLRNALDAAHRLSENGIEVDLLYYSTIKPFDSSAIRESVARTGALVTVEELSATDGLCSLALKASVGVGLRDYRQLAINGFIHGYGTYSDLCGAAGLTADSITSAAMEIASA